MNDRDNGPGEEAILDDEKNMLVDAGNAGMRLDRFLSEQLANFSRSHIQKLIESGQVTVNSISCLDKNYRLNESDQVALSIPQSKELSVEPEDIALEIVYEDEDLLVVSKPRGMVVHPGPGHGSGTLVNALLYHCSDLSGIGGVMRPGIVHRLDKDTSGLLVVAKNDAAHNTLSEQLSNRKLNREYIALVKGRVEPPVGRVEAPIARHPRHRKKMAVVDGGKEAITRYRVQKYFRGYSLLRVNLETGRTHQIRVHLAHIGYPVAGDLTYAKGSWRDLPPQLAEAHALHARKIIFIHPRTGETRQFSVPLPKSFREGLLLLKKETDREDS